MGTIVYNLLDLPVGCIPVTRVDAERDGITEGWRKEGGHGSYLMESGIYKGLYDVSKLKGMPVGIQVVTKKWEEEKLLGIMGVVDSELGPRVY